MSAICRALCSWFAWAVKRDQHLAMITLNGDAIC